MTATEKRIIQEAILNEIEGAQFYRMASMQAPSEEAKAALNKLAEEEIQHVDFLEELANQMSAGEITVESALESDVPSPDIYNWGKIDKNSLSLSLSVFSIGMQMERESIAFYKEARDQFADDKSKRLFDLLIRWEESHLDQFTTQYERYKREWWDEQGYEPY